ncbi:MAG: zinc-dependent metalloprotease [Lentisphaeraceae bacterium]|nr:zinc-dependent metalloprotease [Lentisphaeraceae bacterium]
MLLIVVFTAVFTTQKEPLKVSAFSKVQNLEKSIQSSRPEINATNNEQLFDSLPVDSSVKLPEVSKQGFTKKINLNENYFELEKFTLDLFDGPVTAVKSRVAERFGAKTWVGELAEQPDSQIVLTERNGSHFGVITTSMGLYEIAQVDNNDYLLYEVDLNKLPTAKCNPIETHADKSESLDSININENSLAPTTSQDATAEHVIDIMLVYTSNAANDAGGKNQMELKLINAVEEANQAYIESGVNISWNLVHTHELNYDDSNKSFSEMLSDFAYDESIIELRNEHGADVVSLIVDNGQNCGLAYTSVPERWAYSVVFWQCLSYKSLTHEVGHNQGCYHDRDTSGGGTTKNYHYAHRVCKNGSDGGFRTILGYGCNGVNTPRVNRVSSPRHYYNGQVQGISHDVDPSNSADNARKMNETALKVSSFRESKGISISEAPSNVLIFRTAKNILKVTWRDNSENENGFSVEKSIDGSNWQRVADVAADRNFVNTFHDNPNNYVYYRVRSSNSKGSSSWSEGQYKNIAPTIDSSTAEPSHFTVVESTILRVKAFDNDLVNLSYNWTLVNGPGKVTFSNQAASTTQAMFSSKGIYDLKVTVSDGLLSSSNIVSVSVQNIPIISEHGSYLTEQIDRKTWNSVQLSQSFKNPVIVFSPLTKNGYQPAQIRVKNVEESSFEWQIEEWSNLDGYHIAEKIDYIVLEAGTYQLQNNRTLIAGNTVSSDKFSSKSFPTAFSNQPIVVCQLVSAQDSTAGVVRLQNINNSSFDIKIQSEEAKGQTHGDEIVSYIAVERGMYENTGLLEASSTGTSVNHNWFNINFNREYEYTPSFFASMQTTNGDDTATLRIKNLENNRVSTQVEEEQSKDREIKHVDEEVGYILFNLK